MVTNECESENVILIITINLRDLQKLHFTSKKLKNIHSEDNVTPGRAWRKHLKENGQMVSLSHYWVGVKSRAEEVEQELVNIVRFQPSQIIHIRLKVVFQPF